MPKRFIRITQFDDVSPQGLDGHRYRLGFEVGEMVDGDFTPLGEREVTITTSGTLQAVWNQSDSAVAHSSAAFATDQILAYASADALDDMEPLQLNTYTAPGNPPSHRSAVPGAILPIPAQHKQPPQPTRFSSLSDDISEIRDQINTLAREALGERLLELPQERALIDIYKLAQTAEAFRNRIQSMAGLSVAVNKQALGKYLKKESVSEIGSLTLLEEFLADIGDVQTAEAACRTLKWINELRKGYPTHGDNTQKFLVAHDHFGIPYPIDDHQAAWETILGKYFSAMKDIRELLRDARPSTRVE